jgi:hypothetical protein
LSVPPLLTVARNTLRNSLGSRPNFDTAACVRLNSINDIAMIADERSPTKPLIEANIDAFLSSNDIGAAACLWQ